MSPRPVVPITWISLHPQPDQAPAPACAVCRRPLGYGMAPSDALLCEGCSAVCMHYSCWLRLPADPAVLARLGARLEAIFADLEARAGDDLDRMAELAADIEVRERLVALCPGCRS